jgi:hypothetical protein
MMIKLYVLNPDRNFDRNIIGLRFIRRSVSSGPGINTGQSHRISPCCNVSKFPTAYHGKSGTSRESLIKVDNILLVNLRSFPTPEECLYGAVTTNCRTGRFVRRAGYKYISICWPIRPAREIFSISASKFIEVAAGCFLQKIHFGACPCGILDIYTRECQRKNHRGSILSRNLSVMDISNASIISDVLIRPSCANLLSSKTEPSKRK